MAKGKYAAKAANRLAQTDNELLKEALAEAKRLKHRLKSVTDELEAERRDRNALILSRAHELSEQMILEHKSELEEYRASQERDGFLLAKAIATAPRQKFMDAFLEHILPLLVKDQMKRSEVIDLWISKGDQTK